MCLANDACVQITWVDRPAKCVMYHEIYDDFATVLGTAGWVKCDNGGTDASCAHITKKTPGSMTRCSLYTAIDLTSPVTPVLGCQQWLVANRLVPTQIDYVPVDMEKLQADEVGTEKVPIKFEMSTNFPSGDDVSMRLSWDDTSVTSVALKLRLRMPSWLPRDLEVSVDGQSVGHGQPGTYLPIERKWAQGDTIALTLPTVYHLSHYIGGDQVPGYEGKRYALLIGPVVLACVGPVERSGPLQDTTVLPVLPENPSEWLVPTGTPLHFGIKGASQFRFKPLYAIRDGEGFTVYPIFGGTTGVHV